MRRRNTHDGLVVFWVKLRRRGYTRAISGLYKLLRWIGGAQSSCQPRNIFQSLMNRCGKVQIDVKYVPSVCLVGEAAEDAKECGGCYYLYTFIDEYSRFSLSGGFQGKRHYT